MSDQYCWGWDFSPKDDAVREYRQAAKRFAERYGIPPSVCYVRTGMELPPDAAVVFGDAFPGPRQFRFPVPPETE